MSTTSMSEDKSKELSCPDVYNKFYYATNFQNVDICCF